MQHEGRAFLDVLQRMASRRGRAGGLVDARQQHHRDDRECGGKSESRRRTDPSDQHAAERGAAGERNGARQFDPRIGRGQLLRGHQRGHQRRRGDAVGHRAAYRDEAEQRQQRQGHPAEPDQQQDSRQRRGAQRFGARHQPAPRDAVGEQAGRDRKQDEGQRQRGLQQAGLAFADARAAAPRRWARRPARSARPIARRGWTRRGG